MKKAILRFSLLIVCILTKVQAEDEYNEALRDMLELDWSTEELTDMGEYLLMASPNDERAKEIKSELLKQNNLSAIDLEVITPNSDKPFSLFSHYQQNNLFQILRAKALDDLDSN